ncbi:MAG: AsmA family protein [Caldimonas sp.]
MPSTSRQRLSIAMVVLAVLSLLAWAVLDATWLRPLIQHHVRERSGRQIDFDSMHTGLDASFQPTLTFHNLYVENAAWAAKRPLVRAADLRMHLRWESLWGDFVIVSRLEMADAEFDLERQADGLRNWRLTHPEDRGPGRVRVLAVDAQRTVAHVVVQAADLEVELRSAPLTAAVSSTAHPELPLTRALAIRGTRQGTAFDADVAVGDELTISDTGRDFGLRGTVRVGPTTIALDGQFRDLLQLESIDADLHLSGTGTDELLALLGTSAHLPALATDAVAHLNKDGPRWRVDRLEAKVGASDLAGNVHWTQRDSANPKAVLDATLSSKRLDVSPWRPSRGGADLRVDAIASRLGELDAHVALSLARVDGIPFGRLEAVRAQATVHDGQLTATVEPTAFAGGHAGGSVTIDARRSPASLGLDLRVSALRLARLLNRPASEDAARGEVQGHVVLNAHGGSLDELVASSTGSVRGGLAHASLPESLEAKLGLDGGHWLRSLFGRGERSAITCSALWLQIERGKARVRQLAFETDAIAIAGSGEADLAHRTLDLVLTPSRKNFALIGLDKSIHVTGPANAAHVALVDRVDQPAAETCAPVKRARAPGGY